MTKTHKSISIYFGYFIIGSISLLIACIASFSVCDWIIQPHVSSQGDALGFFIILGVAGSIWLPIAILSQFLAHIFFAGQSVHWKRVGFSFGVPIITAIITTALIAWFL